MDEPCSALDPISTLKIEETMHELKKRFTIVIVTHNMQQALRVSDMTAFYNAELEEGKRGGKSGYLVEFNNISKFFGKVIALKDVTMKVKKGEIMCLLGDNGAGKSTLIKTLSGVHRPDEGEIIVEGNKTVFDSPKEALDIGIATVYQDLALVSLMSVTRNFFMGREPQKGIPFLKTFDIEKANEIAANRMGQIGIDVRDPSQAVGTMSGGERQCLAISRAIYFLSLIHI